MRRCAPLFVLLTLLASALPCEAQSLFPYQLSIDADRYDRYLGPERVGTVTSAGVRYYVDTPDRTRVFALEYANSDNQVTSSRDLELDEESIDLGVCAPLSLFEVKLAGSVNRYALGNDYWAFGVYPRKSLGFAMLNVSGERDADGTVHFGGYLARDFDSWSAFLGGSHERSTGRAEILEERRFGAMVEGRFEGLYLMTFGGACVNPDENPTWIAGIARPIIYEDSGMKPALFLMGRHKPESDYLLGIATLWGQVLNDRVCSRIAESFFNGGLSRSRVVRNRDFNAIGVGRGYDAVDFGKVTATVTLLDVEAGMGAHLRGSQAAVYGTLPRSYGSIHNPYLGLEYQTSTDLVFDHQTYSLEDPNQEWTSVAIGCKFHVNQRADPTPRKRPGYLRLEASFRFGHSFDGAFLTATVWQ